MGIIKKLKIAGQAFKNSGEYENFDQMIAEFLKGNNISGNGIGGGKIDKDQAMRMAAVFACIRVRSETVSCIPLICYQKKDGKRSVAKDSNLYKIFHNKPNKYMSPSSFKQTMQSDIDIYGNAYAYKQKNVYGDLLGLLPIKAGAVRLKVDNFTPTYEINTVDGMKMYTRDDIFHITGMSFDGITGISPIEYAARAAGLGLEYERFSQEFFKNGAFPSVAIEMPNAMTDIAFNRLKEEVDKKHSGTQNAGKPWIIEDGGKMTTLSVNAADSQFIENRKFQKEEIASIYRVPMHLIQSLDRSTNNNIEHQSLEFIKYTMLNQFVNWEEAIESQLRTDQQISDEYYMEFNVEVFQRGDFKTRMEGYEVALRSGGLNPDEVRALENREPIPNGLGQKFFISQNVRGIDEQSKSITGVNS